MYIKFYLGKGGSVTYHLLFCKKILQVYSTFFFVKKYCRYILSGFCVIPPSLFEKIRIITLYCTVTYRLKNKKIENEMINSQQSRSVKGGILKKNINQEIPGVDFHRILLCVLIT